MSHQDYVGYTITCVFSLKKQIDVTKDLPSEKKTKNKQTNKQKTMWQAARYTTLVQWCGNFGGVGLIS